LNPFGENVPAFPAKFEAVVKSKNSGKFIPEAGDLKVDEELLFKMSDKDFKFIIS